MYVNVVFVIRCLYSAVSLTLVKEERFIRIIYYYYSPSLNVHFMEQKKNKKTKQQLNKQTKVTCNFALFQNYKGPVTVNDTH